MKIFFENSKSQQQQIKLLSHIRSIQFQGQKVIYRYGIAILELYYKSLGSQRLSNLRPTFMNEYCETISFPFEKMIRLAFGFRNMSRKNIETVFIAEEKAIKKLKAKNTQTQMQSQFDNGKIRKDSIIHKLKNSTLSTSFVKVRRINATYFHLHTWIHLLLLFLESYHRA